MIANQLTTRMRLLKGDLSKPSDVMMPTCVGSDEIVRQPLRPPPGLPLPKVSGPCRPPPGFPVADMGRLPVFTDRAIGDTITNLQASIVGCHRETVRRDIPLGICPSSNLHYHVKSIPHSRHEAKLTAPAATVKKGNRFNSIIHSNTDDLKMRKFRFTGE